MSNNKRKRTLAKKVATVTKSGRLFLMTSPASTDPVAQEIKGLIFSRNAPIQAMNAELQLQKEMRELYQRGKRYGEDFVR